MGDTDLDIRTFFIRQAEYDTLRLLFRRLYCHAINASNADGESTTFIEFMLSVIKASLIDAIKTRDEMSDEKLDKETRRWLQIKKFLDTHEFIMNADVRALCNVSASTANRILASLVAEGKLTKCYTNGHWAYVI